MGITTKFAVVCPCGCGEIVEATDAGFAATEVSVEACEVLRAAGIVSSTIRKSHAGLLSAQAEARRPVEVPTYAGKPHLHTDYYHASHGAPRGQVGVWAFGFGSTEVAWMSSPMRYSEAAIAAIAEAKRRGFSGPVYLLP